MVTIIFGISNLTNCIQLKETVQHWRLLMPTALNFNKVLIPNLRYKKLTTKISNHLRDVALPDLKKKYYLHNGVMGPAQRLQQTLHWFQFKFSKASSHKRII